MELSKRMRMNADLVPEGCRLADVGCDHGYVSIYLAQAGRCGAIFGTALYCKKKYKGTGT